MKPRMIIAGAALSVLAGMTNAGLVHNTCKQGTSPNLKLMCYAGFNSSADFLAYDYVDVRCEAYQEFLGRMQSSTVRQSTYPHSSSWYYPHLHISVGCPDGYYIWYAVSRTKHKNDPYPGDWQDWQAPPYGDNQVFTCFN